MRAIHLALLELRSYLKDKGDLAFSILLPIALLAVMVGAFGRQAQFNGVANIVDQDGGASALQLIDRLRQTPGIQVKLLGARDADDRLERSAIVLAAYIPQGFSQKLSEGRPVSILFKQRGSGGQEGQIAASIIRGAAQAVASAAQVHRQVEAVAAGSGIPESNVSAAVDRFLAQEKRAPTVEVLEQDLGAKPDPLRQFLPGVVTMFALFALSLRAPALVEERQKGTLERLLTTRLGGDHLFLGKFLAGLAKGVFQVTVLLGLAAVVFGIFTPASFLSALAVAVLFVAAVSAIGLVIASLSRTRDQASWIAVVFTLVMSMLGGTFIEESKSGVLHVLGLGTVNHYANSALKSIVNGTGALGDVGFQMVIVAGVCIVALVLARAIFKVMPGGK